MCTSVLCSRKLMRELPSRVKCASDCLIDNVSGARGTDVVVVLVQIDAILREDVDLQRKRGFGHLLGFKSKICNRTSPVRGPR